MKIKHIIYPFVLMLLLLLASCTVEVVEEETLVESIIEAKPYEEIPGVYLGTFHGTRSSSVTLFEKIGKGVAISANYTSFSSAFPNGFVLGNAAVGRITFITWEFNPGASQKVADYEGRVLEAIIDGFYDDILITWAEGMRAVKVPVFLRFAHEMNGDWYAWSGVKNGGGQTNGYGSPELADGPERYVDTFRYVHDIFTQHGADNVLWVWCPSAPFEVLEHALGAWNRAAAYYPGDDYVDWLGFDGYNWGSSAYGQQFNAQWQSFNQIFASSYAELHAINPDKPIIIGEFSSTEKGGDKAAWIAEAFQAIREDFPQIRAMIWFHITKETDWRIDSSEVALQAYRQAVSDDYWIATYPGMMS